MSIYLNPLVERLARRERWPSVRVALWLAFGLGLAGLAVATRATLRMESYQLGLSSTILLALAWLVTILSPPITSVVAIILVSRDASSEMYKLLRLTTLSEAALVKGYVFAALHRVRALLALVVGLMPALAVGMVQVSILVAVTFYSIMLNYSAYLQEDELYRISSGIDPTFVIVQALACMAIVIGLWGLNWPAAALGVGLALRWRGRVIVTIIAPMVTLLVTLLIAISSPMFVILTIEEMYRSYWGQPHAAIMLAIPLFALLAPYALGAGMTRLAQRWAREP